MKMEHSRLPDIDEQFNAAVVDYELGRLTLAGLRGAYADLFVLNKEEESPSQSDPSAS